MGLRDWTGTRLPMHTVSSGLVLLAAMRPAEIERYLARPMERLTAATVIDPALVRERLRRTALDGFAWTVDEVADGISSVAAPVADAEGEVVGALHVHGPTYRFPGTGADGPDGGRPAVIADEVVAAAARVSGSLRRAR